MIKKGIKLLIVFFVLVVSLAGSFSGALAQSDDCRTVYIPPDTFRTICAGDGDPGPLPDGCTPGTMVFETLLVPITHEICEIVRREVDVCTGEVLWEDSAPAYIECSTSPPEASNPCTTFTITPGGISCDSEWTVAANVSFPDTFLDLRPFPATLVRWPTAVRCGGLPPASGSGTYNLCALWRWQPGRPGFGRLA